MLTFSKDLNIKWYQWENKLETLSIYDNSVCMHVCSYMLDKYLQQEIFPLKGNGKMLAVAIKIANTDGSEMFKQRVPVSSPAIRLFYTIVLIE